MDQYGSGVTPFASQWEPPYFAVIFSSQRSSDPDAHPDEYDATARRMMELAETMPGFLGVESVRGADGFGITVSYWKDEESIAHWRRHSEHALAQQRGKQEWYFHYELRIARVERGYSGP
jgi:heme-degrading monooxygenase HmoA